MKIDALSCAILNALQDNARISLKALSQQINLSLPATSERLKRLEESGIIQGYSAQLDAKALGLSVMAIIGVTTAQPNKKKFIEKLQSMPQVIECLHVTGQDSYMLKVITEDLARLESFVESINHFGETRTSIVLSEPIKARAITPVNY